MVTRSSRCPSPWASPLISTPSTVNHEKTKINRPTAERPLRYEGFAVRGRTSWDGTLAPVVAPRASSSDSKRGILRHAHEICTRPAARQPARSARGAVHGDRAAPARRRLAVAARLLAGGRPSRAYRRRSRGAGAGDQAN